mmetsp:Transcript_18931/g.39411  ORF Transcript_18931/g.39411 Transcript_18931/m.39411 type:complete len:234 (+) Transcript_18931:12-713(+)|eukprot:CAMPEP_0118664138 /NCGR_PEP_ID=MMETSP0785-20121206/17832_1 /TAXON_ID=91992 /ORGANISM="Bolidomonas pacifica, Strain CCMP 1866" /LENGTH=233 /DNA_ID=CAMNT_0006557983 /DNA_START=17 /DNA_END=718 /DNA_ORIENTATION=+
MSIRFANLAIRTMSTHLGRRGALPALRCLTTAGHQGVGKPTIEIAKEAPKEYYEMSNEIIIKLSAEGVFEAIEERLIREIMSVDEVDWDEAHVKFTEISKSNQMGMSLQTIPYYAGIFTAVGGGFASIPLCFDYQTALWFNEHYVTTDIPPADDLETILEVGSWTWNWMEPPLGQISFFLLALQFARAQMENLGLKPYTAMMKSRRAKNLCNSFPAYNKNILTDFSMAQSLID